MKFTYVIAMLLSLLAYALTKKHSVRRNYCNPACKSTEFCSSVGTCIKKYKKGESCSSGDTQVKDQCESGTTCQQNTVTKKWRCADANNKTK